MAQQVVIAGAMFNDVPSISVPDSNNTYHPFTDVSDTTAAAADVASGKYFYTAAGVKTAGTASGGGGGQYPWLGSGAEKVGTIINRLINLANDTDYDSWTASTTATTIIAADTDPYYTASNLNFMDYDYCFVMKGSVRPVYVSGTPMTRRTDRVLQYYTWYSCGYPGDNNIDNIKGDTATNTRSLSSISDLFWQFYYTNTGTLTSRSATQCGPIYMSSYPTFTASAANGTIACKFPAFYAKCDSSRFTTERKGQVDSASTNYVLTVDMYRVPHGNGLLSYWVSQACADISAD